MSELRESIASVVANYAAAGTPMADVYEAADCILAIPEIADTRDLLRQAADSLEDLGHPDVAAHYREQPSISTNRRDPV